MKLTQPQRELIYLLGYGWKPKMRHRWTSYWSLRNRGYIKFLGIVEGDALTDKGRGAFKEICNEVAT